MLAVTRDTLDISSLMSEGLTGDLQGGLNDGRDHRGVQRPACISREVVRVEELEAGLSGDG